MKLLDSPLSCHKLREVLNKLSNAVKYSGTENLGSRSHRAFGDNLGSWILDLDVATKL